MLCTILSECSKTYPVFMGSVYTTPLAISLTAISAEK